MEFQIYYKLLDLPETAGIDQLKKAYREKVKIYHPDVSVLPDAQNLFITITEAYEILLRRLSVEKEMKEKHIRQAQYEYWNEIQKQWLAEQMQKNRQMAYAQSKMKFEEFKKTPTYRATKALSRFADYAIFSVGFFIIFAALAGVHAQYISRRIEAVNIVAVIFVIIVGLTIIFYSLHQLRKK